MGIIVTDTSEKLRLAVLIDADNASYKIADGLFARITEIGDAGVRRVYGDFSSKLTKGWENAVIEHAIVPQQHFANVPGKNATDIALVIDAMDLLHAGGLDGFCIVSSDSDFTRLATRIREHGLTVFGFGKKETAQSFRQACSLFIEADTLMPAPASTKSKAPIAQPVKPPAEKKKALSSALSVSDTGPSPIAEAERLILRALGEIGAGRKWIPIATVISEVRKLDPSFRPQTYGSGLFSELVDKTSCLQAKVDSDGSKKIRMKPEKTPTPISTSPQTSAPAQAAV